MTVSSDEFDNDFRGPLYELRDKLYDDIPSDQQVEDFRTGLNNLIGLADDYRVELLDQEDKAEKYFNARPAPADQGDTCTWELDHGDSAWAGKCGIYWSFIDDGPQENGVKFCPKCGKSCVFVETNQEQDQ
jgi:hypothetical protein